MFQILLLTTLLASSIFPAQAVLIEEDRIVEAKAQFEKFSSDNRELGEREYFLVSLATAVRPEDFDKLRDQYGMRALSAHFCTSKGVLTVGLESSESAASRVAKTNLLSVMGGDKRYISPVELGGDLTPNDPRLCGFEARMSAELVKRFHTEQNANILSIEIGDMKRRFFAVNHNLKRVP
jgi:hypothetical protein